MRRLTLPAFLLALIVFSGCVCKPVEDLIVPPAPQTPPSNYLPPPSCISKGFIVPSGMSCCQGLFPSAPSGGGLARCCESGEVASSTGCARGSQPPALPGQPQPNQTQQCANQCPGGATPSAYPACICPPPACKVEREACSSDPDCCVSLQLHCSTSQFGSACCPVGKCASSQGCVSNGTVILNDSANATLFVCIDGNVTAQAYSCGRADAQCDSQACCSGFSCRSYFVQAQYSGTSYTLKRCCPGNDCLGPLGNSTYGCVANGQTVANNFCNAGALEHVPLRVSNTLLSGVTDNCELVVYIFYNLDVDPSSARDPANYIITGGVNASAVGSLGKNSVFIRTGIDWDHAANYTVSISHVKDSTGVEIPANTKTVFTSPVLRQC